MRFTRFAGLQPTLSPRHGGVATAKIAQNARLDNGQLRAMRKPRLIGECAGGKYSFVAGEFRCIPRNAIVTPSCTADELILLEEKKLVRSSDRRPLCLPAPEPPIVTNPSSKPGSVTTAFCIAESRADGASGIVSIPTDPVQIDPTKPVRLLTNVSPVNVWALLPTSLDGNRDNPQDKAAEWVFVGHFTSNNITFEWRPEYWGIATDDDIDEGRCCPTDITAATYTDAGYLVAASGRYVFISARNRPDVFPLKNVLLADAPIRHLHTFYDIVIALTDGAHAIIQINSAQAGQADNNITISRAPIPLQGALGIAPAPFGLFYQSRDGVVAVTGRANDWAVVTSSVIHPEDYDVYKFKTGAWYRGRLFTDSWVMEVQDPHFAAKQTTAFATHDFGGDYYQATEDGRLLLWKDSAVYEWGTGGYARTRYKSNTIVAQGVRVYTAGKVVGSNLSGVKLNIYNADNNAVLFSKTLQDADNNRPFNMPPVRGQHFEVEWILPESGKEISISETHIAGNKFELARPEGVNQ